jgi:hypothetical protein
VKVDLANIVSDLSSADDTTFITWAFHDNERRVLRILILNVKMKRNFSSLIKFTQ